MDGIILPFSWKQHQDKALKKKLYRSIHLARTNPDYQIKYPNELRDNPNNEVKSKPHKEAEIRIIADHTKMLKRNTLPLVVRPRRLSRNV